MGRGGEEHEQQQLTGSPKTRTARPEGAGRRRHDARRAAAVGRTEAGKVGRHGRSMASLIDSLGGEVEEEPAELVAVSPGLGAAGVSGDVRRPAAHASSGEGARPREEEKEGAGGSEEEQHAGGL